MVLQYEKDCLSEEIFEEISYEESHYKRRSFQRTTPAPLHSWGARFVQPSPASAWQAGRPKTLHNAELINKYLEN